MALTVQSRAADDPDADRLLRGFQAEIASLYEGWSPDIGPSAEPSDFAPPGGDFLVASLDANPVACGGLKRLDAASVEVKRLYVAHAARRGGVARGLMQALEQRARELGYERVRLDTGAEQPGALALFRSLGYTEIEDYNGNPWAAYWLEKRV